MLKFDCDSGYSLDADLTLNNNQLKQVRIENLPNDPCGYVGKIYYNTTTNRLRYFRSARGVACGGGRGSEWVDVPSVSVSSGIPSMDEGFNGDIVFTPYGIYGKENGEWIPISGFTIDENGIPYADCQRLALHKDLIATITNLNNHVNDTGNPHAVTKDQVGLGNVDNTADIDKPVSTTVKGLIDNLQLQVNAIVIESDLIYIVQQGLTDHVNNKSNPHAVTKAQVGLGSVDNTSDANKPVSTAQQSAINGVQMLLTNHENDVLNPHSVTKAQVGLGSVDNTADIDKPISAAQQSALNLKEDKANKGIASGYAGLDVVAKVPTNSLHTGNSTGDLPALGAQALNGEYLYWDAPSSSWRTRLIQAMTIQGEVQFFSQLPTSGMINGDTWIVQEAEGINPRGRYIWSETGWIVETIDIDLTPYQLVANLDTTIPGLPSHSRYPSTALLNSHVSNASNPHGVTKAQVGLGNVDNTSDATKPISTAVQSALNLKQDVANIRADLTSPSNVTYPSTLAVQNAITTVQGMIPSVAGMVKSVNGNLPDGTGNVTVVVSGGGGGVQTINGVAPDGAGNISGVCRQVNSVNVPANGNVTGVCTSINSNAVAVNGAVTGLCASINGTPNPSNGAVSGVCTQINSTAVPSNGNVTGVCTQINSVAIPANGNKTGVCTSINGTAIPANGAVTGIVKSVNTVNPDSAGNVTINASNVSGTVRGISTDISGINILPDANGIVSFFLTLVRNVRIQITGSDSGYIQCLVVGSSRSNPPLVNPSGIANLQPWLPTNTSIPLQPATGWWKQGSTGYSVLAIGRGATTSELKVKVTTNFQGESILTLNSANAIVTYDGTAGQGP